MEQRKYSARPEIRNRPLHASDPPRFESIGTLRVSEFLALHRCQRDPSPSLSLLFLYTRFEIKFAPSFFLFFLSFSNKNNFVITISGKFEKIIIQLHLLLIVEWKLLPNCRLYISLNIGNWTRFYEQERFSFFLFFNVDPRGICRVMRVTRRSWKATVPRCWRIVILLCAGRHFLLPSWATSGEPARGRRNIVNREQDL